MSPKYIIIKIHSRAFYNLFITELKSYDHINYFSKKINGVYTLIIKCQKYYTKTLDCYNNEKIYLNYIYLYTSISIILSGLIIKFYEQKIANQILKSKYRYLTYKEKSNMLNITYAVLGLNYPSTSSNKMYLYRKELILRKLLLNFRKKNYIYADYFAYFKLEDYHEHLENIIQKTSSYY